jgi:hypothetical protein
MTFTKKHSHTISLRNGQTFDWHLKKDWDYKNRWVVIAEQGSQGQFLLINPHSLSFEAGQTAVRNAIRAAFRLGWTPAQKRPPMYLKYDGMHFVVTDRNFA